MSRPRRDPEREILIATCSGIWVDKQGAEYPYFQGQTRVRASHPLARAVPDAFKPIDVHYDVEQAITPPGERRAE